MEPLIILVTGATSGFGKAIAEALAARGHVVYGTGRNPKPTDNGVNMMAMDVCKPETIHTVVNEIVSKHQRIDCLINNAGMGIGGAVEMATPEEIALQMNTNFMGMVNVCRKVLPGMRKQRSGRIINFSSIGGIFAIPYQGFYSASKRAIEAYTESLVLEAGKFGIVALLVQPGDFNTGFTGSRKISEATLRSEDYGEEFKTVLEQIEHDEHNGGTPEYLAKRVVKLVESRKPSFRNVIAVDPLQKLSVFLYKILPYPLFSSMLRMFYHM